MICFLLFSNKIILKPSFQHWTSRLSFMYSFGQHTNSMICPLWFIRFSVIFFLFSSSRHFRVHIHHENAVERWSQKKEKRNCIIREMKAMEQAADKGIRFHRKRNFPLHWNVHPWFEIIILSLSNCSLGFSNFLLIWSTGYSCQHFV